MENEEIILGNHIILNGQLKSNDGRKFGNEGDILAAIYTLTFKMEDMKRLIDSGVIDNSKIVLDTNLSSEEFIKNEDGGILVKKISREFEKPSEFLKYLRENNYKDFK